jgi:hypothetical protein
MHNPAGLLAIAGGVLLMVIGLRGSQHAALSGLFPPPLTAAQQQAKDAAQQAQNVAEAAAAAAAEQRQPPGPRKIPGGL